MTQMFALLVTKSKRLQVIWNLAPCQESESDRANAGAKMGGGAGTPVQPMTHLIAQRSTARAQALVFAVHWRWQGASIHHGFPLVACSLTLHPL